MRYLYRYFKPFHNYALHVGIQGGRLRLACRNLICFTRNHIFANLFAAWVGRSTRSACPRRWRTCRSGSGSTRCSSSARTTPSRSTSPGARTSSSCGGSTGVRFNGYVFNRPPEMHLLRCPLSKICTPFRGSWYSGTCVARNFFLLLITSCNWVLLN